MTLLMFIQLFCILGMMICYLLERRDHEKTKDKLKEIQVELGLTKEILERFQHNSIKIACQKLSCKCKGKKGKK
jgi:hypothetical protein